MRGPWLSLGSILSLSLATTLARGEAAHVLEDAARFEPTVRFGEVGALTVQPLLQARWTIVDRTRTTPPDRAVVAGSSVPRARLIVTTSLYDTVSFRLRLGARSNGDATFEQAFATVRLGDLSLRAGQLFLLLNAGDEPAPQDLSTVDYTTYASVFSGGQTQGAQLAYDGPLHVIGTVGNGARSGFSEFLAPLAADLAGTLRVEVPIGAARVDGFGVEPSFRKGQGIVARIGASGHFQAKFPSRDTPGSEGAVGGGDIAVRGSGFSFLASATYLRLAPAQGPPIEDFGMMVFASIFPARRVETWAQFEGVWPLGAKAPHPSSFAHGQPGTEPFRTVSIGANYYVIPDSNRFKVQLDVQAHLDGQTPSLAAPDPSFGVLATSGPQASVRGQVVLAL